MIYDGLIVGAGPVGLLSANFLGRAGLKILVVDILENPVETSRAIGVTPPTLDIFKDLGLDQQLMDSGVPIQNVKVHGNGKLLGQVNFSHLEGAYPFILSVPQIHTEKVLAGALVNYPQVEIRRSAQWMNLENPADEPLLISTIKTSEGSIKIKSKYIFACDGGRSSVRENLKMSFPGHDYPYTFLMGDFPDPTDWGREARLFFTSQGAVESFPLPAGKRRWIVQTSDFIKYPDKDEISRRVFQRTGLSLDPAGPQWQSPFAVRRHCMTQFQKGNVFFLGDAAHLMSPIGGQGMNTGFADVRDLMPWVIKSLNFPSNPDKKMEKLWNQARLKGFKTAADRAWQGMFLGTRTGVLPSLLRNIVLRLMLNGPRKGRVPLDYAMLTIPQDPRLTF